MDAVFQKTAKGHAEIATRQARLAPRLRTTLILVDGKRSETELRALAPPQNEDALESLLDSGFIESVTTPVSEVDLPLPAESSAQPSAPAPLAAPTASHDAARRAAARWLYEAMGPRADPINVKIEGAKNAAELADALRHAYRVVLREYGVERALKFDEQVAAAARAAY
jgi:hypothetical protein